MAEEFKLPEIGEGVVEGEIVEWHVAPGDSVSADQPLVSMLTDKATIEIAATFKGEIASISGNAGDVLDVGSLLLTYNAEGAPAATEKPKAPKNSAEANGKSAPKGAAVDFPLPEIGEGVMEGEIVEWHVAEGDSVTQDQPLVSVLTDKATIEVPAPFPGIVKGILGKPGDVINVGDPIASIQASEGTVTPETPKPAEKTTAKTETEYKPRQSAAISVSPDDNPSISAFGTPLATPAVRKFAASKGIDLRTVKGTGPKHRITKDDVARFSGADREIGEVAATAEKPQTPRQEVALPSSGEKREKIRGLRKAIQDSMTRSKKTIPHFTYVDEVEMDALVDLRAGLKAEAADQDVKLTYLPFIIKAVVLALKKFPILNASVDDESQEIVYKYDYNVGIATATPSGLTVPVLKQADRKTLLQIAGEVAELSGRARNKRSTIDDIRGGTFTVTSLGRLGGLLSTPIINHPEVGILGIHNLQERPVVRNGEIVVRKMMNIALSFDHRVVDGDVGASFAQEVKSYLENPGKLLLYLT